MTNLNKVVSSVRSEYSRLEKEMGIYIFRFDFSLVLGFSCTR